MAIKRYIGFAAFGSMVALAGAADVNLTASDPGGTSSFKAAGNWDNAQAPSGANDYFLNGFNMRTPENSLDHVFAGNSLTIGAGSQMGYKGNGNRTITIGDLTLEDGGTVNISTANRIMTLAGNITLAAGGGNLRTTGTGVRSMTVTAPITGPGSLTAIGDNTTNNVLQLDGDNNYTGTTTIGTNYTRITHPNALGAISAGTTVLSSGTLQLSNVGTMPAEPLALQGGYGQKNTSGALSNLVGNNEWTGPVVLTGGAPSGTGIHAAPGTTLTISGEVSGGKEFVKMGTGTVIVSGANTHTGGVRIQDGTLRIAGGNDRLPTTGHVTLQNGPTSILDLNDQNQTIGPLQSSVVGDGTVTLGSGTLTVGNGGAHGTFSGTISGTGSLVKTGTGTQTLSGPNTYSGATTVNGGTLAVGNLVAMNNINQLHLDNGATFDVGTLGNLSPATAFSGIGTIDGGGSTLTMSGASNSPGNSPGTLNYNDVDLVGFGTYTWELLDAGGVAGAPGGWDLITVTGVGGSYTVDGATDVLNIAGLSGASGLDISVFGNTTTLPILTATGGIFGDPATISVNPGNLGQYGSFGLGLNPTSDTLLLTFTSTVPEPGTWAIFGLLAALVVASRLKRNRTNG